MSGHHETRTGTRVIVCGGGMVIISGMERLTFEVVRSLRSKGVAVHFILCVFSRIVFLAVSRLSASQCQVVIPE